VPFVRLTLSTRYPPEQRARIADGVHQAMVDAIGLKPGNRFQVVYAVEPDDVRFDPDFMTGGREDVVCVEITLVRGREPERKAQLYRLIAENLAAVGVRGQDVFIVLTENGRDDWSVGLGQRL
jgi:phenylpyruvate tautomerase PptA (4-oxalocrotonate tautomerase family)